MPDATPVCVQIQPGEIGPLLEVSQLFLKYAIELNKGPDPKVIDEIIVGLQRVRSALSRFTELAKSLNTPIPIEVLDIIAKKQARSLVQLMYEATACAVVGYLLQALVIQVIKNIPPPKPPVPEPVDPRLLNDCETELPN